MLSVRGYKSPCLCFHRLLPPPPPPLLLPRQDITIPASCTAGAHIQTHTHTHTHTQWTAIKTEQRSTMMGTDGWFESEGRRGDRSECMMRCIESKSWWLFKMFARTHTHTHTHTHTAISAEQGESTLTHSSCSSIVLFQTVLLNVTRCLFKVRLKAPICGAVGKQFLFGSALWTCAILP